MCGRCYSVIMQHFQVKADMNVLVNEPIGCGKSFLFQISGIMGKGVYSTCLDCCPVPRVMHVLCHTCTYVINKDHY